MIFGHHRKPQLISIIDHRSSLGLISFKKINYAVTSINTVSLYSTFYKIIIQKPDR